MRRKTVLAVSSLAFLFHVGSASRWCPSQEQVAPCTYTATWSRTAWIRRLECENVNDVEDVRRALRNVAQCHLWTIRIKNSSLPYLPHEVLDGIHARQLYLEHLTLGRLFDSPPLPADRINWGNIEELTLRQITLSSGVLWKVLETHQDLKYLYVHDIDIEHLGKEFMQYVPRRLRHFSLHGTKTRTIEAGTFNNHTHLVTISVSGSKLEKLSRNIFPEPFNGERLYFSNNSISKVPEDMFHKMPNIAVVILSNNLLSTLPESAFEGKRMHMVFLKGNPLKCDCNLQWIVKNRPYFLRGKCETPKNLNGKELKTLQPSDFTC